MMQMTLPTIPIVVMRLPNIKTDKKIITTCFTFPTTFIIRGPPSLTALKFAMFNRKANMPWTTRIRIQESFALVSQPFRKLTWEATPSRIPDL